MNRIKAGFSAAFRPCVSAFTFRKGLSLFILPSWFRQKMSPSKDSCYTHIMHWFYLALAISFEVAGTTCIKLSEGFKNTLPSVLIFVFYGVAFYFLSLAVRKIDISVSYAIWSGVGTALIALIGIYLFKETMTVLKLLSITLIIAGVAGLNLGRGGH